MGKRVCIVNGRVSGSWPTRIAVSQFDEDVKVRTRTYVPEDRLMCHDLDRYPDRFMCSKCRKQTSEKDPKYCPWCGTRVDPDKETYGSSMPVRCVETGRVFPSQREAAAWLGVSEPAMTYAVRNGWRSGGYHWKPVGKEQDGADDVEGGSKTE